MQQGFFEADCGRHALTGRLIAALAGLQPPNSSSGAVGQTVGKGQEAQQEAAWLNIKFADAATKLCLVWLAVMGEEHLRIQVSCAYLLQCSLVWRWTAGKPRATG